MKREPLSDAVVREVRTISRFEKGFQSHYMNLVRLQHDDYPEHDIHFNPIIKPYISDTNHYYLGGRNSLPYEIMAYARCLSDRSSRFHGPLISWLLLPLAASCAFATLIIYLINGLQFNIYVNFYRIGSSCVPDVVVSRIIRVWTLKA